MSIQRLHTGPRMSQAVVHGNTIYLAGQVGNPDSDITNQTKECLEKVDSLLAACGSSKEHILSTTIWLADMKDFAAMNAVWDAWVSPGNTPCRACVEAKLASDKYDVEIMLIAAK